MAVSSTTNNSLITSLLPKTSTTTATSGFDTAKALKDAVAQTLTTSLGAGQFDVTTISKALAAADVATKKQYLTDKQTAIQTKVGGYDLLSSALDSIKTNLATLNSPATFNAMSVTASDSTALSSSITGKPAAGAYDVTINQRAQAHTLASVGTPSQYTALGTGTFNLTVGGSTKAITIDSSNNTLQGLKGAINSAGLGVNASIVNDGSGYRLVMAAQQTGQGNGITLDVVDGDGNNTDTSGLSQFAFGAGTNNMAQTVAAQDAQFNVNGLSLTSTTNTAAGVIDGVTLNLNKAQPGVPITLTVGADTAGLSDKVQSFVDDMNAMHDVLKYLGSYSKDPEDPTKGSLKGEQALKQVDSNIKKFLQFRTSDGGAYQSLADIGIKSNLDGTLSLDTDKLTAAISADPSAVGKLFSANAVASDGQVSYTGSSDKTIEGKYNLTVNQSARQALYLGGTATGAATDPITIASGDNSFALSINGTASTTLSLAAGTYTRENLAKVMQTAINNDANLKAKGLTVQMGFDSANNRFQLSSDKFGSESTLNLTSLSAGMQTSMGLATGAGGAGSYAGQDVMGSLEKDGTAYTFAGTGQHVKINSFLTGAPRDLEFDIAGTATGSRGSLTFQRGFGAQMTKSITDMFDAKNGAIGVAVTALGKRDADYTDKLKKVEVSYESALARYTNQFSIVNQTISSMNSLRTSLSASLSSSSSNG
jgi:flagellar hook-associated protein 2